MAILSSSRIGKENVNTLLGHNFYWGTQFHATRTRFILCNVCKKIQAFVQGIEYLHLTVSGFVLHKKVSRGLHIITGIYIRENPNTYISFIFVFHFDLLVLYFLDFFLHFISGLFDMGVFLFRQKYGKFQTVSLEFFIKNKYWNCKEYKEKKRHTEL